MSSDDRPKTQVVDLFLALKESMAKAPKPEPVTPEDECDHAWSDPSIGAPPVTCSKCGAAKVRRVTPEEAGAPNEWPRCMYDGCALPPVLCDHHAHEYSDAIAKAEAAEPAGEPQEAGATARLRTLARRAVQARATDTRSDAEVAGAVASHILAGEPQEAGAEDIEEVLHTTERQLADALERNASLVAACDDLRAQLATVTRERDEYSKRWSDALERCEALIRKAEALTKERDGWRVRLMMQNNLLGRAIQLLAGGRDTMAMTMAARAAWQHAVDELIATIPNIVGEIRKATPDASK